MRGLPVPIGSLSLKTEKPLDIHSPTLNEVTNAPKKTRTVKWGESVHIFQFFFTLDRLYRPGESHNPHRYQYFSE